MRTGWIELASTNLGLTYTWFNNYARSGTATFDLPTQLANFGASTNLPTAPFSIWSGPVDFYYHLGDANLFGPFASPTNDLVWNAAIRQGVNNLSNAVMRLYFQGGRSFLVPNIDDVSRQPVVITWHTDETRQGVHDRVTHLGPIRPSDGQGPRVYRGKIPRSADECAAGKAERVDGGHNVDAAPREASDRPEVYRPIECRPG